MVTSELSVSIERLTRDLKDAAHTLSSTEARFLVDSYYQRQEDRIERGNQIQSMSGMQPARIEKYSWHLPQACVWEDCHKSTEPIEDAIEPHSLFMWLWRNEGLLEKQIARALDAHSASSLLGQWARSIPGIGPVIAAGLIAHIDITKAPTAGSVWRFAGLDPSVTWDKGLKRPWNASLKTLCWKIGESFVKVHNSDEAYYGKAYAERRAIEDARNEAGEFAALAERQLAAKKYSKDTEAYKAYTKGKLPKGYLYARAKRFAVKLFLSHYHHVAYEIHYDAPPPNLYVIEHMGHAHYEAPPNWPM